MPLFLCFFSQPFTGPQLVFIAKSEYNLQAGSPTIAAGMTVSKLFSKEFYKFFVINITFYKIKFFVVPNI